MYFMWCIYTIYTYAFGNIVHFMDFCYSLFQLQSCFGPHIYRPHEDSYLKCRSILTPFSQDTHNNNNNHINDISSNNNENNNNHNNNNNNINSNKSIHSNSSTHDVKNDRQDCCYVVTTPDVDFKVTAVSESTRVMLGDILGRTLISADWVEDAIRQLQEWRPYVCELQSGDKGGFKYFCQLFPVEDREGIESGTGGKMGTGAGEEGEEGLDDMRVDMLKEDYMRPKYVMWVITKCPYIDTSDQIYDIIRLMLKRTLGNLTLRFGSSGLNISSSLMSLLLRAHQILESKPAEDGLMPLVNSFIDWVDTTEFFVWKNPLAPLSVTRKRKVLKAAT
jgi:hypothetical protein